MAINKIDIGGRGMKTTDELIQERIDKYNEENECMTLNDKQAKQLIEYLLKNNMRKKKEEK